MRANFYSNPARSPLLAWAMVFCIAALVPACAVTALRTNPVPEALSGRIQPFGQPDVRTWGDALPERYNQLIKAPHKSDRLKIVADYFRENPQFLSISGGGANGAYGAGVIVGLTKSGRRPNFSIVTGVSTGALIAPFAFLGPDYDWVLTEVYNTHGTDDLVKLRAVFSSLFSDAFFDSSPLKQRIAGYLTMDEMRAIAAEHKRGRILLIGTTDMDALRPVMWNVGMIAGQGTPEALELIHRIILASASIPVAFPPVIIKIAHEGKIYQELHTDGGVTNQVFLFPPGLDWKGFTSHFKIRQKPDLYIIRNDRLAAKFETTRARLKPLASRSIDSLIRTQGIGDLYRLYVTAVKENFHYHLSHIPDAYNKKAGELFDPEYMRPLFQIGYEQGKRGGCWYSSPPGLVKPGEGAGSDACHRAEGVDPEQAPQNLKSQ